jgi:hypothetical protein
MGIMSELDRRLAECKNIPICIYLGPVEYDDLLEAFRSIQRMPQRDVGFTNKVFYKDIEVKVSDTPGIRLRAPNILIIHSQRSRFARPCRAT